MYQDFLVEAITADRLTEIARYRLGQEALRLAKVHVADAPAPPLWQRPFTAIRRASVTSNLD